MREVSPIKDLSKIKEVKRLMTEKQDFRDLLIFTLGINAGLRISDILKLKWRDIVYQNGKIREEVLVKEKKTGKTKKFPLNDAVVESVKFYMEKVEKVDSEEWIFQSRKRNGGSRPISRIAAWQMINKYCKSAGIKENVGTHTLRKTFGYHQYKNGTDIAMLQKMLNHSSPKITLRYIGIEREEMNERYKSVNL
jgi:integrase